MNYPATTECISGNHVDCSGSGPLIDAPFGSRKVVDCKCTCHDEPAPPEPREPAAREAVGVRRFAAEWRKGNPNIPGQSMADRMEEFALAYSAELRAALKDQTFWADEYHKVAIAAEARIKELETGDIQRAKDITRLTIERDRARDNVEQAREVLQKIQAECFKGRYIHNVYQP